MLQRRTLMTLGAAALVLPSAVLADSHEAPAEDMATPQIADMTMGNPDAAVTVIEYASYTCPHCANFHARVMPELKAQYIDTGKINFVYREVFFDRPGLWAAMLARCGGEMRYFAINSMLFEKQREWIGDGQPATISTNLRTMGLTAGLEQDALDACFRDQETAQAMVDLYEKNWEEYDVSGTPALVVNGKVLGAVGFEELSEAIEAALGS